MFNVSVMIINDIKKCEDMIKEGFATRDDLDGLIAKYRNFNPNFGSTIIYYVEVPGHKSNYVSKIKIIRNELEGLLLSNNFRNDNTNQVNSTPYIVNNVYNNQYQNNNSNNLYLEVDKLVEKIMSNIEDITDNELKQEIIDNVEGIQEELKKSEIKKGRIKSFMSSLQTRLPSLCTTIEVSAAIADLITFAQQFIK